MTAQPSLFQRVPDTADLSAARPQGPREMADTSLQAFDHVRLTLTEREETVFLAVCDYITATGYEDVTGQELADHMRSLVTSVRPRLTGLVAKGWLQSGSSRPSRARYEGSCHPVFPALPRSAVVRARAERQKNQACKRPNGGV